MKNIVLSISLLIGFNFFVQAQKPTLIAKYNFNANAKDLSGNGHDLTVKGATLTKNRNGKDSSAYHFNGSQYLWAVADTQFSKDEFTTAFWIKPESTSDMRILTVGPEKTYWHYYCNTTVTGKFSFVGHNKDGSYSFYNYAASAYSTNTWTHVISTYKGDTIKIYINGKLSSKLRINNKVVKYTTNQLLQIGAAYHPDSPLSGFRGDIDDVRIFSQALNSNEAKDLFNEKDTVINNPKGPCLLAKFNFSKNSKDSSGNNIHLTNKGATFTKNRAGKDSSAYHFNGSQYLWATVDSKFSVDEFTTAFWVKPESTTDARILAVGPENTFWHYYCNTTVQGKFSWIGHNTDGSYSFYNYAANTFSLNKWSHVVSTYKGDTIKIYINGKLSSVLKINNKVVKFTSNQLLQVGAAYHPSSPKSGFTGDIDDIRIFCSALDAKQALELYHEGDSVITPPPPDKACVLAKYNFDRNSKDSSGNNNHLTNKGATFTKDRFGKDSGAYHFNGSQYLWTTVDSRFSNDEFTTAFWARPESDNGGSPRILAVGPQSTFWHYYCNVIVPTVNSFGFIGHNSDGSYSFYNYASKSYTADKWVHVVSTYKGDSMYVYVDGYLSKRDKINNTIVRFTSNQVLQIGAAYHPDSPKAGYKGDIDDIRIYCKALTATEVKEMYDKEAVPASLTSQMLFDSKISIYPNPAKDVISIEYSIKGGINLTGEIFNFQGQLVKNLETLNGSGIMNFKADDLAYGIYYVRFNDYSNGVAKTFKLVIQ